MKEKEKKTQNSAAGPVRHGFKWFLKKVFALHPLLAIIIALLAANLLTVVFIFRLYKGWYSVFFYLFSLYALAALITSLCFNWRNFVEWYETEPIVEKAKEAAQHYKKNYDLRGMVSLIIVLVVGIANIVFRFFQTFYYHDNRAWYASVALYYTALFILNIIIFIAYIKTRKIKDIEQKEEKELKVSRIIGYLMTFLTFAMEGMLVEMIYFGKATVYTGRFRWLFLTASIVYVAYAGFLAIRNVITFKKSGNELLVTSKVVRMAQALMALVALQATLIYMFGDTDPHVRSLRISLMSANGNLVTIILIAMTLYLIIANTKKLHELKKNGITKTRDGKEEVAQTKTPEDKNNK